MKVVLTGATGFLGSHLLEALLKNGYEVAVLKRSHSNMRRILPHTGNIKTFNVDEIGMEEIFSTIGAVDVVIHAATFYGHSQGEIGEVFRSNVEFPFELLEQSQKSGCSVFINTDSFFSTPSNKYSHLLSYSLSKRHFREWCELISKQNGIKVVNLKLYHLYGVGDNEQKFCTDIINRCIHESGTIDLTQGEQRRDFVNVIDVVNAYIAVIESSNLLLSQYNDFDVGYGRSFSIREFVEKVHEVTDSNAFLNFGALPTREGEFEGATANISFLRELGWKPEITLENGISIIVNNIKKR